MQKPITTNNNLIVIVIFKHYHNQHKHNSRRLLHTRWDLHTRHEHTRPFSRSSAHFQTSPTTPRHRMHVHRRQTQMFRAFLSRNARHLHSKLDHHRTTPPMGTIRSSTFTLGRTSRDRLRFRAISSFTSQHQNKYRHISMSRLFECTY